MIRQIMLVFILYSCVFLILWQYLALRLDHITRDKAWRPSTLIESTITWIAGWAYSCGELLAYISSFYVYLGLGDLINAFCDIILAVFNLIKVFNEFRRGYFKVSLSFSKPHLILFGTITLVLVLGSSVMWWCDLFASSGVMMRIIMDIDWNGGPVRRGIV